MLRVGWKAVAFGLGAPALVGSTWSIAVAREGDFGVATPDAPALARATDLFPIDRLSASRKPGLQIAHAVMTRTAPQQGATAVEGLTKVEIWYDSAVRDNMLAMAVIDASGTRVDNRDPKVDAADQTHVFASVQPLAPGSYTVRYRAISVDGFLASGSWNLTVVAKRSVAQLINH
ncbi:MAG: copper resistance protein CopC [Methylocystis sp.]